ncbi:MAG: histone deacetylase [Thermomicrobiales bacterium]|nr:histone deacetylase [Thermomicrobiales bacterium]
MNEPSPSTTITRQTAIFHSPLFASHDEPQHVENQRRLQAIERRLQSSDLLSGRALPDFAEAPLALVELVHNAWYVERLDRLAMGGGAMLDSDTYIGANSYDVALSAAGAAVAAVDWVLEGHSPTSFALVRPPGHHATPERGMGFCLVNNVAVAAVRALQAGLERVAIVDWDVHHGNGTQDAFYSSDKVLFCSVHQYPFYPGTGAYDERGEGPGEGLTVNVPLLAGQTDAEYLHVFNHLFLPALRAFRPELILISAGYDAHVADPLGGMKLTEAGFSAMTGMLLDVASQSADGRVVAVLEGGYDPPALARSVEATLRTLDGERIGV